MFYIRTDANEKIATGHVMRCLSIAEEFKIRGRECTFITADKHSVELIASRGFDTICLNTAWNDMESELDVLCELIGRRGIKRLLVDSYYATDRYLEYLSRYTKVIYIDDLGEISCPVNTIINYNNYAEMFKYKERFKNYKVNLILGSGFVPLRSEFQNTSPVFNKEVKNVLISTGGGDIYNVCEKLLKQIASERRLKNINFMAVSGKLNKNLNELLEINKASDNIEIYTDVRNMSELMLKSDMAVTAGGSTMYELCACGVPMISYTFADNQLNGAKGFAKKGASVYAGDIRQGESEVYGKIIESLISLKNDALERKKLIGNQESIVNKNGVKALADALEAV